MQLWARVKTAVVLLTGRLDAKTAVGQSTGEAPLALAFALTLEEGLTALPSDVEALLATLSQAQIAALQEEMERYSQGRLSLCGAARHALPCSSCESAAKDLVVTIVRKVQAGQIALPLGRRYAPVAVPAKSRAHSDPHNIA